MGVWRGIPVGISNPTFDLWSENHHLLVMTISKQDSRYDAALDVLRRERLRVTSPRRAMLKLLVAERRPLSAEEIHQQIGPGNADLVTVYRSLEAFEKAGIVQRILLENGKGLFELVEENHHYHHIICRKCHRAEKLDFCEAEKLMQLASNLGYSQVSHVLELYGICSDCDPDVEDEKAGCGGGGHE